MSSQQPEQDPAQPHYAKPIYLLASSPLVAGGKARVRSNKKVAPTRAKPREVSAIEAEGYTDQQHKALKHEPEPLDQADWDRHIRPRADQDEATRLAAEQRAREQSARLLSQEERIRRVELEAQVKRRDVSREMWMLKSMLRQGRKPEVIEKRLQNVERIVILGRAA